MNYYSPEFFPRAHGSRWQVPMEQKSQQFQRLLAMVPPDELYQWISYQRYCPPSTGYGYGHLQLQVFLNSNQQVGHSSDLTRNLHVHRSRITDFSSPAQNATEHDTLQRDSSKASHFPQRKDDRITKHTDGSLTVKCQKHKSAKHVQRQKNHKLSHYVDGDQKKTGAAVSSVFNNLLGTRLNDIRNMEFTSNGEYFASVTEASILNSHNPIHRNSSTSDAASNSDDVNSVSSHEDNYDFVKVNKKTARVRNNRKQRRQLNQEQQKENQRNQSNQSGAAKCTGAKQNSDSVSTSNKDPLTATVQQHQQPKTVKDHILAVSKVSPSSSSTSSPSTSEANSASSSPTASPKAKRMGKIRHMRESPFSIVDILSEEEIVNYMSRYVIDSKKLRGYGYPVESSTYEGCIEIYKSVPRFLKQRNSHMRPITRKYSSGDSGKGSELSSSPSYNGSPAESDYSEEEIAADFMYSEIVEKKCERCKKFFKVTTTGEYVTKEPCHYHWGKQEFNEYIDENGELISIAFYSCCRRLSSDPCSQNHMHVWSDIAIGLNGPYTDFVFTSSRRLESEKEKKRKIFALDCEMSYTGLGMEVTKITILGYNGKLVYASIVYPRSKIVDYNTRFSGVSEKDFAPGNDIRTFETVQNDLLNLIDADDILIGHAVENDLRHLRIVHKCIVDTSIVFPHPRGFPFRRGLKSVVADELGRVIQFNPNGHCSLEDSEACLELMLMKIHADWKARCPKKSKSEMDSYDREQLVYGHYRTLAQHRI